MGALKLAEVISGLKPTEVIRNETVRGQFIRVYDSIWKEGGENVYEREAIFFNQQIRDNKELRECSSMSIYFSFIDLAVRGITLAPGPQCMCYLLPRNSKVGVDQNGRNIWEKTCNLTISAYGELTIRAQVGQIKYADNPVIVYEGDFFESGERDGKRFVNYSCTLPRKSNTIIACFIKITRADGEVDYSVMTKPDWERLAHYSEKNNTYYDVNTKQRVSRGANELYGSNGGQIDTGFLIAKCVKHAFKTYPKIQIGRGTALESELPDNPQLPDDPYGVGGEEPAMQTEVPQQEQSFAEPADMSKGVRIPESSSDDTF